MRSVHHGPVAWLVGQVTFFAVLATTVGLGGPGWVVGLTSAVVVDVPLARGLARRGAHPMGPADRVTLTRATLVCGVAALTADAVLLPVAVEALVALTVVALMLDGVDGAVARRTGTASALGARFDMEVDAFLILVLSAYAARSLGLWVLVIGMARYAFVAAGWVLPWMRGSLPPRYWRKVVAAVQGVVLTVVAADVLPASVVTFAVVAALALLTESFGRDVLWLWRHQPVSIEPIAAERVAAEPIAAEPVTRRRERWLSLDAVDPDGQLPAAAAPDGC